MSKYGRKKDETDYEAGAGADTQTRHRNLEEAAAVPPVVTSHGPCPKCNPLPAVPDPKGLHKCARCRSELLPEVAERRAGEQAAERQKREADRKAGRA
jgi:hypothetical protein